MMRHLILLGISLQVTVLTLVDTAKQQVQLSDSYLPVAMQIIAHLTDQMAYEVKDEVTPSTSKPSTTTRFTTTTKATTTTHAYVPWTTKPTRPPSVWWSYTSTKRPDETTPYHKPGYYAPVAPPKPGDRFNPFQQKFALLPMEQNSQYTVIGPKETRTNEPFLAIHNEEIKPLVEPSPEDAPLLPPFDVKVLSRSDGFVIDDEEGLQYLSDNVRDMYQMARDPNDERVVDVWDGARSGPQPASSKATKLSTTNLRLLLLYDLLSREAKRQRLSDYSGFSPDVMKTLVESSSGGARAQLRTALSKMVDRHDCEHEYANNRAKEMVEELAKDESKLSSELRYLQPLVYKY